MEEENFPPATEVLAATNELIGARRIRFHGFCLELDTAELRFGQGSTTLAPQPMQLLLLLLRRPNRLVSNQELITELWGDFPPSDGELSLSQATRRLRREMEALSGEPAPIKSLRGRGRVLEARISVEWPTTAGAPSAPSEPDVTPNAVDEDEKEPANEGASAPVAETSRTSAPWFRRDLFIAAFLVLLLAAGLLFWARAQASIQVRRNILNLTALTASSAVKLPPLLTDGSRIYYERSENGVWSVGEVATAGGPTESLATTLPNPDLSDLTRDGSQLLVRSLGDASRNQPAPFWTLPLVGGTPRQLNAISGVDGAFTPDGHGVVITNGSDLSIASLDSLHLKRLVHLPGTLWWPRFSLDGRQISFTYSAPDWTSYTLWEVNRDGSDLHPMLSGWKHACCGNWSPDGKTFVFSAARAGQVFHIWALHHDWLGRAWVEQLTAGDMDFQGPVFSRDGSRIFVRGYLEHTEVLRYNPAAQVFTRLLPFDLSCGALALTKDGRWLATVIDPGNQLTWRRGDNTDVHFLADAGLQAALPTWSPDGRWLAFMGRHLGRPWHVYLADRQSGIAAPLPGNAGQADPTWSPDGKWLAFGAPVGLPSPQPPSIQIYSMADHRLRTLPDATGLYEPRWSPRGDVIATLRPDATGGGTSIVLYSMASHQHRVLAHIRGGYLNWSHDGRYLYFLDTSQKEANQLARVSLSGTVKAIASLSSIPQPMDVFGNWVGLDNNDDPIVTHDLGHDEIYALNWTSQ